MGSAVIRWVGGIVGAPRSESVNRARSAWERAITSISTRAPFGRAATPTVDRAGGGSDDEPGVDRVHRREVAHVDEEHRRLDDIRPRHTGRVEARRGWPDPLGLRFDPTLLELTGPGRARLAGGEHVVVGHDGLAVRADRGGRRWSRSPGGSCRVLLCVRCVMMVVAIMNGSSSPGVLAPVAPARRTRSTAASASGQKSVHRVGPEPDRPRAPQAPGQAPVGTG